MANFSPNLGVTNPSTTRPTVIPNQNPVATIPLAKGSPCRTRIMKVTIHPPSATSTPTYSSRKNEQSQVILPARFVNSALRRLPPPVPVPPVECCVSRRKAAPVSSQKQ
jgi:hypothetical protein